MKNQFILLILALVAGMLVPALCQAQGPGRAYFVQGENMRKQNRCQDAIDKYNDAITAEPTNYKYWFAKGKCEYKLKKLEDAKESFKFTVEYRQDYSPAYSLLAKMFKNEENYEEAAYYYEQAARYERSDARKVQYKLLLINLLLKEDRTSEAYRHIEDARALAPNNPNILYYTAEIAATDKDWESARRDYERALESENLKSASPGEKAKFYYGLGVAYSNLGDNENARRAWSKANFGPYKKMIQQHMMETSHVYYYKVAVSYYLNGEFQEAETYIQKSLDLQNDFSRAFILRGRIEKKQGNISRAIDHYQRAIEMEQDPKKQGQMYALVASLQLNNNDSYGALTSLDRALSVSPNSTKLMYMKAKAEYGSGRYEDTVSTLDQLLSAGVDTKSKARYNFMKGMAARRSGDLETAQKSFQGAMYGPYKPAAKVELDRLKEDGRGR